MKFDGMKLKGKNAELDLNVLASVIIWICGFVAISGSFKPEQSLVVTLICFVISYAGVVWRTAAAYRDRKLFATAMGPVLLTLLAGFTADSFHITGTMHYVIQVAIAGLTVGICMGIMQRPQRSRPVQKPV